MIVGRSGILEWAQSGGVDPFVPGLVNPASLDLRLGDLWVDLDEGEKFQSDAVALYPGRAILATTLEYISMPVDCAGVVYLKSTAARQGLDHALAGWIDPGFCGELTLELHAHRLVKLEVGQRVVQLVLIRADGAGMYCGRYQGQRGPTVARREFPGLGK